MPPMTFPPPPLEVMTQERILQFSTRPPCNDRKCQVVLHGKPIGNQTAAKLFAADAGREHLRKEVYAAYDRLARRYNPIVLEGAGSISEINLRQQDLVNMPMALHAGADVILVGDIDRGGVFASLYGSVMLLTEEERARLKGILINKFRGDLSLFEPGRKMLEKLCGVPVLGVIPYYRDIHIEEEDSVMLAIKHRQATQGKINIAVILLRHLSNFTDFNSLERHPKVHLFYTNDPTEVEKADIVILPGSKSTMADLCELRRNGMAQSIVRAAENDRTVLGICGGYQMMGQTIHDPLGVESDMASLPGLGLLPVETTLTGEKVTRQTRFRLAADPSQCGEGYEIHMGTTTPLPGSTLTPLLQLEDGTTDGFLARPRCLGSYLHGIADNPAFVDFLLAPFADRTSEETPFDYHAFKEEQYDKLADHVRRHTDMKTLYAILTGER